MNRPKMARGRLPDCWRLSGIVLVAFVVLLPPSFPQGRWPGMRGSDVSLGRRGTLVPSFFATAQKAAAPAAASVPAALPAGFDGLGVMAPPVPNPPPPPKPAPKHPPPLPPAKVQPAGPVGC